MKSYPRFFEVDDIYVVLELVGDEVVVHTHGGRPYGIGKTIVEGREITRSEYIQHTKNWRPIYLPS